MFAPRILTECLKMALEFLQISWRWLRNSLGILSEFRHCLLFTSDGRSWRMAIKMFSAPSTFAVSYQLHINLTLLMGQTASENLKDFSWNTDQNSSPNSNWLSLMLRKVKKKCSLNYQCSHDTNKNWQSDAFDVIDLSLNLKSQYTY